MAEIEQKLHRRQIEVFAIAALATKVPDALKVNTEDASSSRGMVYANAEKSADLVVFADAAVAAASLPAQSHRVEGRYAADRLIDELQTGPLAASTRSDRRTIACRAWLGPANIALESREGMMVCDW